MIGRMNGSPPLEIAPTWLRRLRKLLDHPIFILSRDFTLFLKGSHTDAAIKRARRISGSRTAFELAYTSSPDPWASASSRYRYQQRKYEQILSLLPSHRFRRALDLGCGLGLLSQLLAIRADTVVGIDFAEAALGLARARAAKVDNLSFVQGDILNLDPALDGQFDLIVIADIIYYLSPLTEEILKSLSIRVAKLLSPDGICVLANHFFFGFDTDSKISQRIHDAFSWSSDFTVVGQYRKAFFLTTVLSKRGAQVIA